MNLFKRIVVTERLNVELRAEFFNFFNHPQYGSPSAGPFAPSQTSVGAIGANVTSTPPGRFLQPHFVEGGGRVVRYQLKIRF